MPNKVRIGWHFSSNKYAYRDVYSALKSKQLFAYSATSILRGQYIRHAISSLPPVVLSFVMGLLRECPVSTTTWSPCSLNRMQIDRADRMQIDASAIYTAQCMSAFV